MLYEEGKQEGCGVMRYANGDVYDAELKEVEYMRSVSESNRAYHEQAAGEATEVDEGALRQRKQAGEAILADLDRLGSSAHCIKKSNFFK